MELDEFKSLLNRQPAAEHSEQALREMLRKKGNSALDKVIRNLKIELLFGAILLLGLGLVAIWNPESNILRGLGLFLLIILVAQFILYRPIGLQLQQLRRSTDHDLLHWLESLYSTLSRFVKYYQLSMVILFPAGLIIGGMIGYNAASDPSEPLVPKEDPSILLSALTILGSLLLIAASWWFMKWAIRYLYGQYLNQLTLMIAELKGEESNSSE